MPHPPRRPALLAAALLGLGTLFLGALPAQAAPPSPVSPAGAGVPTDAARISQKVLSPDGTRLYLLWGTDEVVTFDTATMREVARLTIPHEPRNLAISPDGRTLYVGNGESYWVSDPVYREAQIVMVDTSTNTVRRTISIPGDPLSVTVSQDGTKLVFPYNAHDRQYSYSEPRIGTLDLTADQSYTSVNSPDGSMYDLSYSADLGTAYWVATDVTSDPTAFHDYLYAVDLSTGSNARIPAAGRMLATSADGRTAVIGGDELQIVDLPSMTVRDEVQLPSAAVTIAVSADGATAAGGMATDPGVFVLDVARAAVTTVALPSGGGAGEAVFLPDGRAGLLGADSQHPDVARQPSLYVVDPADGVVDSEIPGVGYELLVAPDGSTLYSNFGVPTSVPGIETQYLGVADLTAADWHPAVGRIGGADRYAVSAGVSQAGFPDGASVAYVASGEVFADALSASTAAAAAGGPLLLTARDSIPLPVLAELRRLRPERIVVVGGPASVGPAVQTMLKGLGADVSVVSGADRYANSREIVARSWPEGAKRLFIASGETFADALSASSAAHAVGAPLLVVHGSGSTLDAATLATIKATGADTFTIVGGPNTVTPGIASQLTRLGSVERFSGADRYETSAAVNAAVFAAPAAAYFSSGSKFPDALSGGVLAALRGAPIYVVPPSCVPRQLIDRLAVTPATDVTLLGGEATLDAHAAALGICAP